MSENEDQYHDIALNLKAKVKKNMDTVLKIRNSLQGMFMLGPKPMSFYDSKLKHGLGYANPYTLKKYISQYPKLYDASCLDDSKIHMNVRDTENILEDATKSQIKLKNKMKDEETKYVRAKNQDLLLTISELKAKLKTIENGKSVNTKFDNANVSNKLLCVTPSNKQVFQKKTVVPKIEEKHVLSKTVTLQTSPNKQQAGGTNENVIAPGMYKVRTSQVTNTNKAKSVLSSAGPSATSSVRRPSNRDSSFKNSVVSNTKNSSKKVEVSDRTNKKPDVASKNVGLNTFVTNDEIKNALITRNVLCISCAKNVRIPCHDNCLVKYKLNMHSNVRRALFTTPRIVKSTFKDTTLVVSKTRFYVRTVQSKSLDTTPVVSKAKIVMDTPLSAKNKGSIVSFMYEIVL
ncbi:hypothetical protein Tco_0410440 [Tanacetum coccineum]